MKCLLVADEGVLWTAAPAARSAASCPPTPRFKVSALVGPVNPASYAVYERLGADSHQHPLAT